MPDSDHAGSVPLRMRQLSGPTDLALASSLLAEVFGAPSESLPVDLLTAVECSGGFVGGAWLDRELVGVAVGFGEIATPGSAERPGLHSHVAAVRASARGLRVGQRLKWYQRDWALDRGIRVIHWTFDPLVRRNATLNLNRLGAVTSTYRVNLYGPISDALNAGMESDRLLVRWELDSPRVLAARERIDCTRTAFVGGARVGSISTPRDIETLVRTDLPAAREWRRVQRQAFRDLPVGWVVTGIDEDGNYEVENA